MNSQDPKHLSEAELESSLHRELRNLPPLKAPETLIPRVLSLIQEQAVRHSWFWSWPRWWQAVFMVLLLGLGGGIFVLGAAIWQNYSGTLAEIVSARFSSGIWSLLSTLTHAATLCWRVVGQPLALGLLGFSFLMYLFSVGIAAALFRYGLRAVPVRRGMPTII